jgi:hypothetical protein
MTTKKTTKPCANEMTFKGNGNVSFKGAKDALCKKIHVVHHPAVKVPILLTPDLLPPEPFLFVPEGHPDPEPVIIEKARKKHWYEW